MQVNNGTHLQTYRLKTLVKYFSLQLFAAVSKTTTREKWKSKWKLSQNRLRSHGFDIWSEDISIPGVAGVLEDPYKRLRQMLSDVRAQEIILSY